MRILILSDIHSNFEALQAVMAFSELDKLDACWVLGDITGYGPDPDACITAVKKLPDLKFVRGNHDRVVSRVDQPLGFNRAAITAAYKNLTELKPEDLKWLAEGNDTEDPIPGIRLCHGSPMHPDEYLLTLDSTMASFRKMQKEDISLAFFGHTHVPAYYEFDPSTNQYYEQSPIAGTEYPISHAGPNLYLINPGSVGQPRDGNPQASFAILELGTSITEAKITFYRVDYQIFECQQKMIAKDYPEILVNRIQIGF